jgi:hypothetical protein
MSSSVHMDRSLDGGVTEFASHLDDAGITFSGWGVPVKRPYFCPICMSVMASLGRRFTMEVLRHSVLFSDALGSNYHLFTSSHRLGRHR